MDDRIANGGRRRRTGTLPSVVSLFAVGLGAFESQAGAATRRSNRIYQVVEVDKEIEAIQLGDYFALRFTLDDQVTDTQPADTTGIFPGLVTSFVMTAMNGNAGSWMPSGTFDLSEGTYYTSNFHDSIGFHVLGSGFPDAAPDLHFAELDLVWDWPSETSDSGLGDTFDQQLGPLGEFGTPPAVFLGNGIEFEYESDPGIWYEATLIDVTIFTYDFESSSTTCDWSASVGDPGCD